jgi:endo-alpha-1,4-polygalactosaminidase (GH114 family)
MADVTNIIYRVEGADSQPHESMENVADPSYGIWVVEHDILPEEQEKYPHILKQVVEIAQHVKKPSAYIHISLAEGHTPFPFRLPSSILREIADAGCTLEIDV